MLLHVPPLAGEPYSHELDAKIDDPQDLTLDSWYASRSLCFKMQMPYSAPLCCTPWQDVEVRRLVADRKGCRDRVRRLELSNLISKAVRCADIVPQKPSEYFRSSAT